MLHGIISAGLFLALALATGVFIAELATGAPAIRAALGKRPIPQPRYSPEETGIQEELARMRQEGVI